MKNKHNVGQIYYDRFQAILQSHSNKNTMVLAYYEKCITVK